jgi:transposase
MLSPEIKAEIKRLHNAEHLTCNAIAKHLRLHHLTVGNVLRRDLIIQGKQAVTPKIIDPYLKFIEERIEKYPSLRAPRLLQMLRDRGFNGSVNTVRRAIRSLRPRSKAYLPITTFIGDEAQVDWAHFGTIKIGRAERRLSCFAMVLAYSRAMFAYFFLDQTLESFLTGHIKAFEYLGGVARRIRYDNLKAAVAERHGSAVRFNPTLLDFAGHYSYEPSACNPYSGHEKGRVERSIRYIRDNFFMGRSFRSVEQANRSIRLWLDETANQRAWVDDKSKKVVDVWGEEKSRLIALPTHPYFVAEQKIVRSAKTPYVRYDLNDYSIPFGLVKKPLTLIANESSIQILDGQSVVACHKRSYSRGERITKCEHFEGLYEQRPGAHVVASREYLVSLLGPADDFFRLMVDQGEVLAPAAAKLTELLKQYGNAILTKALEQAIERKMGRYSYVAKLCHSIELAQKNKSPKILTPLELPNRPELISLTVKQHELSIYDDLHHEETTP